MYWHRLQFLQNGIDAAFDERTEKYSHLCSLCLYYLSNRRHFTYVLHQQRIVFLSIISSTTIWISINLYNFPSYRFTYRYQWCFANMLLRTGSHLFKIITSTLHKPTFNWWVCYLFIMIISISLDGLLSFIPKVAKECERNECSKKTQDISCNKCNLFIKKISNAKCRCSERIFLAIVYFILIKHFISCVFSSAPDSIQIDTRFSSNLEQFNDPSTDFACVCYTYFSL